jgi:hypothetical protein
MMPRLAAEETLAAAMAVALGSGTYKSGDAQRIRTGLERQAGASRRAPRASYAVLSMMGIGVEVED